MRKVSSFVSKEVAIDRLTTETDYDNIVIVKDNIDGINTIIANMYNITDILSNLTLISSLGPLTDAMGSLYADKTTLDSLFADKVVLDSLYADKVTLDVIYADVQKGAGDNSTTNSAVLNALGNATQARLEKWLAEAHKMTSDSYATEAEDVLVKVYNSNGDGTFSSVDTVEYSALHYSNKTNQKAATIPTTGAGFIPFVTRSGDSDPLHLIVVAGAKVVPFVMRDGSTDNIIVVGA